METTTRIIPLHNPDDFEPVMHVERDTPVIALPVRPQGQLTARKTKHTVEIKALQKAMGESEQVTDAYYKKAMQAKLEKKIARNNGLFDAPLSPATPLFMEEVKPVTAQRQTQQPGLF